MEVALVVEKMRVNCLRWFEYVHDRPLSASVRKCDDIKFNQARGSGISKLTCTSVILKI